MKSDRTEVTKCAFPASGPTAPAPLVTTLEATSGQLPRRTSGSFRITTVDLVEASWDLLDKLRNSFICGLQVTPEVELQWELGFTNSTLHEYRAHLQHLANLYSSILLSFISADRNRDLLAKRRYGFAITRAFDTITSWGHAISPHVHHILGIAFHSDNADLKR